MQWRLENTNNQLIVISDQGSWVDCGAVILPDMGNCYLYLYLYLPWIVVSSFVIWATAICHPECCRLFPAWVQMRDYCHQPTTPQLSA